MVFGFAFHIKTEELKCTVNFICCSGTFFCWQGLYESDLFGLLEGYLALELMLIANKTVFVVVLCFCFLVGFEYLCLQKRNIK